MLISVILEQNVLQKWNILFCGLYMLAERKGYVKDFVGGTISVMCKETKEEVWSKPIEEV